MHFTDVFCPFIPFSQNFFNHLASSVKLSNLFLNVTCMFKDLRKTAQSLWKFICYRLVTVRNLDTSPPSPTAQCMLGYTRLGRHSTCRYTPLGRPPPTPMATAADSTHPTGMHSCLLNMLAIISQCVGRVIGPQILRMSPFRMAPFRRSHFLSIGSILFLELECLNADSTIVSNFNF